eukprot:217778-Pyramimonas_sp.AAC.1
MDGTVAPPRGFGGSRVQSQLRHAKHKELILMDDQQVRPPHAPAPFPGATLACPYIATKDIPELLPAIGQPQFCDPIPMLFYPAIGRPNRFWPFDAGQVLYLPPPVLSWVSPGYTVPDLASRRTRVKASGNLDHHCRC